MWHDRTLEVVGSTPIGSTNFFNILRSSLGETIRKLSVFCHLTVFVGAMMIGTTTGTLGCSSKMCM